MMNYIGLVLWDSFNLKREKKEAYMTKQAWYYCTTLWCTRRFVGTFHIVRTEACYSMALIIAAFYSIALVVAAFYSMALVIAAFYSMALVVATFRSDLRSGQGGRTGRRAGDALELRPSLQGGDHRGPGQCGPELRRRLRGAPGHYRRQWSEIGRGHLQPLHHHLRPCPWSVERVRDDWWGWWR